MPTVGHREPALAAWKHQIAPRPTRYAAKRARTIPDCEIGILPRTGHIMSVDEPEFVGARIANFLQRGCHN